MTDWFEAGLYLPLYSISGNGALTYNGFKVRALFVEPDAANQRFFYGVNFEFSWNTAHWDPSRHTQEIRPIVGWHLGALDIIVNPILDNSYKGFSRLDFAPATRVAYNFDKTWAIAAEEYADFGPLRALYSALATTASAVRRVRLQRQALVDRGRQSALASPAQPTTSS